MIRAATADDLPALTRLEEESFGAEAWSGPQIAGTLHQPGGFGILLLVDGAAVGHVLGWALVGESELLRVGVQPGARRSGHGGALLGAFHAEAALRSATRLFLEVRARNTPAQRLYLRHGWREAGRRRGYYPDGDDALVLTWDAA